MGTRYIISVTCPRCGARDDDIYYAPTCSFTTHRCACGNVTDLVEYTGVFFEDASNAAEIGQLVRAAVSRFQKRGRTGTGQEGTKRSVRLEKYGVLSDLASTHRVIKMLLAVLPDSFHDHDSSWEYCWNELSDDAQEQVGNARREASQLLGRSAGSSPETGEQAAETGAGKE